MSFLHIGDVDPRDKARWVAVAQHLGMTLPEWVSATLNAAANQVEVPPPVWMRTAGFSERLARCLTDARLVRDWDILAEWERRTQAEWEAMPNFGRRCYEELQQWVEARRK